MSEQRERRRPEAQYADVIFSPSRVDRPPTVAVDLKPRELEDETGKYLSITTSYGQKGFSTREEYIDGFTAVVGCRTGSVHGSDSTHFLEVIVDDSELLLRVAKRGDHLRLYTNDAVHPVTPEELLGHIHNDPELHDDHKIRIIDRLQRIEVPIERSS